MTVLFRDQVYLKSPWLSLWVPLLLIIGGNFFIISRKLFYLLWYLIFGRAKVQKADSPTNLSMSNVGQVAAHKRTSKCLTLNLPACSRFPVVALNEWPVILWHCRWLDDKWQFSRTAFYNRLWYLLKCSVLKLLLPHLSWLRRQPENTTVWTNKSWDAEQCSLLLFMVRL